MRKFLFVPILFLSLVMSVRIGFAQYENQRKYLGLQLGVGTFASNTNQYNEIASYNDSHVKSQNIYPQITAVLSVFPVTSKYNIDIGTGGWEGVHKIDKNAPSGISTDNEFKLDQQFVYCDINFSYCVVGSPRTLIIPAIGIGFKQNDIDYTYKTSLIDEGHVDADGNEDYSGGNDEHINIAKNKMYYLNYRLSYLMHLPKVFWWGFQLGYKHSFEEKHSLYNPQFSANANHLLNGFYASVIIAI
ncbi:MAG TPA: hypothetical protein VGB84_06975 [Arachidicoccus sp.]